MSTEKRKMKILYSIIDTYILRGEPVGSKKLLEEFDMGISSATIRNDMNSLEKMGFLTKSHSSSGRLPSNNGYRKYVDEILNGDFSTNITQDYSLIRENLEKSIENGEDVIENATKILSAITHCTAVSTSYKSDVKKLVSMKILEVKPKFFVMISVYDNGLVLDDKIKLDQNLTSKELDYLNEVLTNSLVGLNLVQINKKIDEVKLNLKKYEFFLNQVKYFFKKVEEKNIDEVYVEGLGNIFYYKEFSETDKAKDFIRLFDSKENIEALFSSDDNNELVIKIGDENEKEDLKENTLITACYKYDGIYGKIGILGPTRINYSEIIPDVKLISLLISK
ncbi:MAG: heat-inducible transcriptional repressor HrcA [Peptoniphilaceae bacterium]|nr:heat-inducible transcriptional repressor HrcA [Peptoniphilaceae bacterium]MDD7383499.1 heat-inducible transcriptional repressor HrcA [Peptoniphilaceae bacterium]MDY3738672.1 heat-inducible transcriptional repressor HrcA [Peptoniphilaceae bacterium]